MACTWGRKAAPPQAALLAQRQNVLLFGLAQLEAEVEVDRLPSWAEGEPSAASRHISANLTL